LQGRTPKAPPAADELFPESVFNVGGSCNASKFSESPTAPPESFFNVGNLARLTRPAANTAANTRKASSTLGDLASSGSTSLTGSSSCAGEFLQRWGSCKPCLPVSDDYVILYAANKAAADRYDFLEE
jgi:hypothetical protein